MCETKYGQRKGRDEKLRQEREEAFSGPPLGGGRVDAAQHYLP